MKILMIAALVCVAGTAYGASLYDEAAVTARIRAEAEARAADSEALWLETKQRRLNQQVEELEQRVRELEDRR